MDLSEGQILKYALDNKIIDVQNLRELVEKNEKMRYLKLHNHKIWQGKNGYYYTKVDDRFHKSKRKLIKKLKREDLENAVIAYYKDQENKPCVRDVFHEWITQKLRYGEIQKQTAERYEIDFHRFFSEDKWFMKKFCDITDHELEEFIKASVCEKKLTAKAWGNMRTLLNGMFKYAKKRGYTDLSITAFLGELELSDKIFEKQIKRDEDCVFTDEEMKKLISYLQQKPTLGNLGVLLAAYTGMRVGEAAALKWEDVHEKYLSIQRTQIRYHADDGAEIYEIRNTPKTAAGIRKIVIVDGLKKVLQKLQMQNPSGEYLLEKNGCVMTKHALEMCLYRACDKVGIPQRSMHVLRKTYATRLLNSHVDDAVIINQMGHTDIETTKSYYYYNDKTFDKMADMIGKAINY